MAGSLRRLPGAVLLLVLACEMGPPDIDRAFELYREGHINEARRDMAAYVREKPFNPESEEARQHILLIRRIKRLESVAVEQWRRGNFQGARKLVGILRILHPVYVDSTVILHFISSDQSWAWSGAGKRAVSLALLDTTDATVRDIIPAALTILNRQEQLIIHLSREWETIRHRQTGTPLELMALSLRQPVIREQVQMASAAHEKLKASVDQANPLSRELERLGEQLHGFLESVGADTTLSLSLSQYGFQDNKGDMLRQILSLKLRLVPRRPGPAAADTSAVASS